MLLTSIVRSHISLLFLEIKIEDFLVVYLQFAQRTVWYLGVSQIYQACFAQAQMVARDQHHIGHIFHANKALRLALLSRVQNSVESTKS